MRRDYTEIDLFRYVKFLEENPHLKNSINGIAEYNKKFPKLTIQQMMDNIKNFDWDVEPNKQLEK